MLGECFGNGPIFCKNPLFHRWPKNTRLNTKKATLIGGGAGGVPPSRFAIHFIFEDTGLNTISTNGVTFIPWIREVLPDSLALGSAVLKTTLQDELGVAVHIVFVCGEMRIKSPDAYFTYSMISARG